MKKKRLIWAYLLLLFSLVAMPITSITAQQMPTSDTVYQVAWSPANDQIAFVDYTNTIRIWDGTTKPNVRALLGNTDVISALRWSPDGTLIAANSYTGKYVKIWDAITGVLKISIQEETGSLGLDWTPDGKHLLTGTDGVDGTPVLRRWDVMTGNFVESYPVGAAQIYSSPDDRTLALVPSISLELRDASTLELIAELDQETDYEQGYQVTTAKWSSDGRFLAIGYLNGMVRIWEVDTSEIAKEFQANEQIFENLGVPPGTVKKLAFSLDGTSLWSVSADGTLRQWELQDGRLIVDQPLNKAVFAAAWSPYQARLALGVAPDDQPVTTGTPIGDELHSSPGLQILVPTTSIEQIRLTALACMDTQQQQELGIATLTSAELPGLVAKLHALPITLKSTACFADVLALANALNTSARRTIH